MHLGGAFVGRRGRILKWALAPQDGNTPLWIAAAWGHFEAVKLLVAKGADKDAPGMVRGRGGRGRGCWVLKNCTCFLLGVGARLRTVSLLTWVGGPSIMNGRKLNGEVDFRLV